MPYVDKDRRRTAYWFPEKPGELNYAITQLLLEYVERVGVSYATYNDCLGALEGAKLELYRRVISAYEDKACERNGDVYAPDIAGRDL